HDTPAAGAASMARALSQHHQIDAAFAVCDPVAVGAVAALTEAGAQVPIVSIDGRADAVDSILAGGPIIASVAQDPVRLITTAITIARDLACGRSTGQNAHLIPVRLIHAGNAREYERWG